MEKKTNIKNLRNESALSFSSSTGEIVRRFNFNAQLNYDRNWGLHRLNTVLLYAMDRMDRDGQNASRAYMDMVGQAHYSYKTVIYLILLYRVRHPVFWNRIIVGEYFRQ